MHEVSHVENVVLGIAGMLLVGAGILWATKRVRFPYTVVLVLSGMGLAEAARQFPHSLEPLREFVISPDLIFFVFLPTLVFESAFNLDARQLRRNLAPVLMLAVPGLLLSTLLIGAVVSFATTIPFPAALLLGAILSATDPVAVIALFKQIGAPLRLTVLVEGESLLNDATSIVVSKILLGVVMAGVVSMNTVMHGAVDFVVLFAGGLTVGLAMGYLTGYLLGRVESDPFIEITLTTVLAYLSFVVAEAWLHVSGIMATIGAGLALGGWGRMKVSPSVRHYLEHFWEYAAFIANTLIFLMVGLRVEIPELWNSMGLLVWVIIAMLLSRAVVVYGLMPLIGRGTRSERVPKAYQTVMFWGGLRGAIALAIVMSLPEFEYSDLFFPIVMGAALFTLLAQGTTISLLMRKLGLAEPPLPDRMARLEVELAAEQRSRKRIQELMKGGLFSGAIGERLLRQCNERIGQTLGRIDTLRGTELHREQELQLLYLRCMTEEKSLYIDLFNKGHLSERSFRELLLALATEVDSMRYHRMLPLVRLRKMRKHPVEQALVRLLSASPGMAPVAEGLRLDRVAINYEEAWGHFQGSSRVLEHIHELARMEAIPDDVVEEVRKQYLHWQETARKHLDLMAEQFPEFVGSMQERLGSRLRLIAELETSAEHAKQGALPKGLAEEIQSDIDRQLRSLRGHSVERLKIEPEELLRQAPFFQDIPPEAFVNISKNLRSRTVNTGDTIIRQDEEGESLFIVARGVVRVSREDDGAVRDLASLMAGDFFGEMALLHPEPRVASVRAVTPCALYELRREDLEETMREHPIIRERLEETDRKRKTALRGDN